MLCSGEGWCRLVREGRDQNAVYDRSCCGDLIPSLGEFKPRKAHNLMAEQLSGIKESGLATNHELLLGLSPQWFALSLSEGKFYPIKYNRWRLPLMKCLWFILFTYWSLTKTDRLSSKCFLSGPQVHSGDHAKQNTFILCSEKSDSSPSVCVCVCVIKHTQKPPQPSSKKKKKKM